MRRVYLKLMTVRGSHYDFATVSLYSGDKNENEKQKKRPRSSTVHIKIHLCLLIEWWKFIIRVNASRGASSSRTISPFHSLSLTSINRLRSFYLWHGGLAGTDFRIWVNAHVILEVPRRSLFQWDTALIKFTARAAADSASRARDSQSRAKGLSTFKKSPIHFCNRRAVHSIGADAHSWSSWPCLSLTSRNFLCSGVFHRQPMSLRYTMTGL